MVKRKNMILITIIMFIFGCLLTCGIFAAVSKSVSFNLALKVEPNIYFAMSMQVSNDNGVSWSQSREIFNNVSGENVVNWATVNQNSIVLNQVLAGTDLPSISNNSKIKLTVTNLTEMNAGEYLHLRLNYLSGQHQTFSMDNGYGVVNLAYETSDNFVITATNILADTYILIPFLAEVDTTRYGAKITTTQDVKLISAPITYYLDEKFEAKFTIPKVVYPYYYFDITVRDLSGNIINEFYRTSNSGALTFNHNELNGHIEISARQLTDWNGLELTADINATYGGGMGTSSAPYRITTALDLAQLSATVNGGENYENTYFILVDNITLNEGTFSVKDEVDYEPTYNGEVFTEKLTQLNEWVPIGHTYSFNGTFYGAGTYRTISGLYIHESNYGAVGLFSRNGGQINKITITNSYVSNKSVTSTSNRYYSILCGENTGRIELCSVSDSVLDIISSSAWSAAGLVSGGCSGILHKCISNGYLLIDSRGTFGGVSGGVSGRVLSCINKTDVIATSKASSLSVYTGGVVGNAFTNGLLRGVFNCFSLGLVHNTNMISGGIVGDIGSISSQRPASIMNCCSMSAQKGVGGGVCGDINMNQDRISHCYWLDSASGGVDNLYLQKDNTPTIENISSFGSGGTLNQAVTIAGTEYTTVLNALNAWVDENKYDYYDKFGVTLASWVAGDDGYPTLSF